MDTTLIKAVIYKITSPSGKIYIGQSINLKKRLSNYKSQACKNQTKLYNSVNKYGWDNHTFEIIDECPIYCRNLLNLLETYWIKEYNSVEKGLNCNYGGDSPRMSEETKRRISEANKGRKCTEEQKKNMGKAWLGKSSPAKGRKRSEENKIKWKETYNNNRINHKKQNKLSYYIIQLDDNGDECNRWDNYKDAALDTGFSEAGLKAVIYGQRKQIYGIKFKKL